jgi:hypothetical protein
MYFNFEDEVPAPDPAFVNAEMTQQYYTAMRRP